MNKHIIIGNLTQDPTAGTTRNGTNYCRFKVAVNRPGKDAPADFIRVTAWKALGDTCLQYLKKGRKVMVCGRSSAAAWQGNDGRIFGEIQMDADEVEFLSPKGQTEEVPDGAPAPEEPPADPSGMTPVEADDLPF